MSEPVGKIQTPEGEQDVLGYIRIRRDEREVMVAKIEDGTYCFETKSWLLVNGRKEVTHQMRFSETTMVMLMETLHLAAGFWNIDLVEQLKKLSEDKNRIQFEYAGDGNAHWENKHSGQ